MPRVMLIRKDGELASNQMRYVDDIHPTTWGISDDQAKIACKQPKSVMNSVGDRTDYQKIWFSTTQPGAWKGKIMNTEQPSPQSPPLARSGQDSKQVFSGSWAEQMRGQTFQPESSEEKQASEWMWLRYKPTVAAISKASSVPLKAFKLTSTANEKHR